MTETGKYREIWRAGVYWVYFAVFTQSHASGGDVIVDVSPGIGQEMIMAVAVNGADDYAADRTVQHRLVDDQDSLLILTNQLGTIDNERFATPANSGAGNGNQFIDTTTEIALMLAGEDKFTIRAASLAQDETLTVYFKARVLGNILPTIEYDRSGGTVAAPTVTYNEFR